MHTGSERHGTTPLRLLLLDGTPGATTLLLLAAHGAIPRFDYAAAVDTGCYPTSTYRHLERVERVALDAGIGFLSAGTDQETQHGPSISRISGPLFTRAANGEAGRLPNRCARRQALTFATRLRHLLDHNHPYSPHGNTRVECSLGVTGEHVHNASITGAMDLHVRYPLLAIGWTNQDCRAYLHHHDFADVGGMACTVCPQRSDSGWAELRATDPEAFEEAVALDAALRDKTTPASPGVTKHGTAHYLHPDRVPLDHVTFDTRNGPHIEGCLPRFCRGLDQEHHIGGEG